MEEDELTRFKYELSWERFLGGRPRTRNNAGIVERFCEIAENLKDESRKNAALEEAAEHYLRAASGLWENRNYRHIIKYLEEAEWTYHKIGKPEVAEGVRKRIQRISKRYAGYIMKKLRDREPMGYCDPNLNELVQILKRTGEEKEAEEFERSFSNLAEFTRDYCDRHDGE